MENKISICFYYQTIYPGLEKSIFLIEKYVDKNKFDISYVFSSKKMFLRRKKGLYDYNLTSGFAGFDNNIKKKFFLSKKINILDNKKSIKQYLIKKQIVVTGSCRDNDWLIKFCKLNNIFLAIQKNPANFDTDGTINPDLYLVHSNYLINKKNEKFTYNIGSLHYEFLYEERNNNKILKKYKLKKNNFLIFFDEGPQFSDKFYLLEKLKILNTLKKSKYEIIIKLHPTLLQKRKLKMTSFFKIYLKEIKKNFKICNTSDYPALLNNCLFGISNFGTIFYELNYFGKPILYINRLNYYKKLFNLKNININSNISFQYLQFNKFIKNKKYKISKKQFLSSNLKFNFKFYGADITDEEILKFLKQNNFIFKKKIKPFYGKKFMQIIYKKYRSKTNHNLILNFYNVIKFLAFYYLRVFKTKFL
tara:strand:+ start:287 stop:1543 length:1257 start_codon:yes stop_codon:yes gene_type:complete